MESLQYTVFPIDQRLKQTAGFQIYLICRFSLTGEIRVKYSIRHFTLFPRNRLLRHDRFCPVFQ